MKRQSILLYVLLLPFFCYSNNNIYSGGMLIFQSGYLITENDHQSINRLNFGIGGILRFYFCKNFTAGIYGGSQRTNYKTKNSSNSFITTGYGGVFLGYSVKRNNYRYTVAAFTGKGTIKNLHIENEENHILTDATFHKKHATLFSPILSIDYPLTERLVFTFQAVCLITKFNNRSLYNPIFQLGLLFNR